MERQRQFLTLMAILTIASLLAACAPVATPAPAAATPTPAEAAPAVVETPTPAEAAPAPSKYNEAPMLAELVQAGKLPPVDERLPKNPLVGVTDIPADWLKPEIGKYGGTLRLVDHDQGSLGHDAFWIHHEPWFQAEGLQHDNAKVKPNLFESYEVSPDGKIFTIHMREGLRYSDGTPMTSEDVEFWWKDVMLNEKLTPVIGQEWRAGRKPDGEVMTLEVIDKYTFKFIFAEPYGGFPARWTYWAPWIHSKKFMSQFHADYTPLEKLEPLIKEKGFEPGEWWRLFWYMTDFNRQHETGMPSYTPWMLKSFSPTKAVLERNPYYFKVDAAGNQLPYIDYMEVNITSNTEASTVKVIAGEVDLVRRDVNAANLSLYKQYEKEKGYKVILLDMHASAAEVFLNLTNPDPVWRQVVRDVRFREALSLAIDRQQIIDAIYFGVAGPPRTIPRKEYDPEKANQLLDEMGLDKKDANGCRLGPDGNPFIVSFTNTSFTGEDPPTAEMVKKFWDAVGVCTTQKTLETNLWLTMAAANELKAFTWWAHYPRWPWHEANDYIGVAWQTTYAPLWVQWYRTNGQEGEKPPQEYIDLREMQNELFSTPDVNRQRELWEKMKKNIYDNIWWIPITDDIKLPLIVNAKLGNVPETGYHLEVATAAEMFFYKE